MTSTWDHGAPPPISALTASWHVADALGAEETQRRGNCCLILSPAGRRRNPERAIMIHITSQRARYLSLMSQEKRRPIILSEKLLHSQEIRGKIAKKNGWIGCPVCKKNHRLLRVTNKTEAYNLPVYCRICGCEIVLIIGRGPCE